MILCKFNNNIRLEIFFLKKNVNLTYMLLPVDLILINMNCVQQHYKRCANISNSRSDVGCLDDKIQ